MSRKVRQIISIDETKCNGCGLCISACVESALQLVDGKARLVSDVYCDGLGNCLGECPQGAITIIERAAEQFDEIAVEHRLQAEASAGTIATTSQLENWPVQLALVPAMADYFDNASLLLCADCVPCAVPDFHQRFITGNVLVIGCPKLDDKEYYLEKLTAILSAHDIRSLHVVYMEVPCCTGLVRLAQAAIAASHSQVPLRLTQIAVDGSVLREEVAG